MESSLEAVNFGKSMIIASVQEMAKESMTKIPPRYERPDQDPSIISTEASLLLSPIPVIDLERLTIEDSMDSELDSLHSACREWGFFQAWMGLSFMLILHYILTCATSANCRRWCIINRLWTTESAVHCWKNSRNKLRISSNFHTKTRRGCGRSQIIMRDLGSSLWYQRSRS